MVMMNYNSVADTINKLNDLLSLTYVLMEKIRELEINGTIVIDDNTKKVIEKIKVIMRSKGANV